MSHFKLWRRLVGGRWSRVTGWFFGYRWVRLDPECEERADEQYCKRYCCDCLHRRFTVDGFHLCDVTGRVVKADDSFLHPGDEVRVGRETCNFKNRHNDCRDFDAPGEGYY